MPTTQEPATVLQVRAIGNAHHVRAVLTAAAQTATDVLGPNITTRTHTRSAGRIGYVRAYLTVTRKDPARDHHGG